MGWFGKLFGKEIEERSEGEVLVENAKLILDRDKLRQEVRSLREKVKVAGIGERELVSIDLGDPSPTDTDKRKTYVAGVAGLHEETLKPKLRQMISHAHNLLEDETNDERTDMALKGAIYAFREFIHWGDAMVNEQVAYQSSDPSTSEEEVKS